MVAVIIDSKKVIGLRILETEGEQAGKTKDVGIASLMKVLGANKATVENIGLSNGKIVCLNGKFNNFTKLNRDGTVADGTTASSIIIDKIGDAGFTVADHTGKMKKRSTADVMGMCESGQIANGYIADIGGVDTVIPYTGEYAEGRVAKSKLGDRGSITMNMVMPTSKGSVAQHTKEDVKQDISDQDVFRTMTQNQKQAIQMYYVWHTVDVYRSMAKNIRLDIKESKAEALSELRGELNWEFGGIIDRGFNGASKCQLGHPLRYEYYAVARDENKEIKTKIIFGETCAGDFFSIRKEDMAKLVKTRMQMTDEIKIMADMTANNGIAQGWENVALIRSVVEKLSKEDLDSIFGGRIASTLLNFLNADMPFPCSLVKMARKKAAEDTFGMWKKLFTGSEKIIDYIAGCSSYGYRYSTPASARDYFMLMAENKLDGIYAYDPVKKVAHDEGSWDKKARSRWWGRHQTIKNNLLATQFTLNEAEKVLKWLEEMGYGFEILKTVLGVSKVTHDDIDRMEMLFRNEQGMHEIDVAKGVCTIQDMSVSYRSQPVIPVWGNERHGIKYVNSLDELIDIYSCVYSPEFKKAAEIIRDNTGESNIEKKVEEVRAELKDLQSKTEWIRRSNRQEHFRYLMDSIERFGNIHDDVILLKQWNAQKDNILEKLELAEESKSELEQKYSSYLAAVNERLHQFTGKAREHMVELLEQTSGKEFYMAGNDVYREITLIGESEPADYLKNVLAEKYRKGIIKDKSTVSGILNNPVYDKKWEDIPESDRSVLMGAAFEENAGGSREQEGRKEYKNEMHYIGDVGNEWILNYAKQLDNIENADSEAYKQLMERWSISVKIAKTVLKTGRASNKQLYYIKKGAEFLKKIGGTAWDASGAEPE